MFVDKMSQPSIDGLKLALHDHDFCVENSVDNPNATPDLFLKKLNISQMRHCGRIPSSQRYLNYTLYLMLLSVAEALVNRHSLNLFGWH